MAYIDKKDITNLANYQVFLKWYNGKLKSKDESLEDFQV